MLEQELGLRSVIQPPSEVIFHALYQENKHLIGSGFKMPYRLLLKTQTFVFSLKNYP